MDKILARIKFMEVRYEQEALSSTHRVSLHRYKNLSNLPHWHKEHEIVLLIDGEASVTVNGIEYFLDATKSAFIKCEDIHSIKSNSDAIIEVMKIHNDLIRFITDKYSLNSPIISPQLPSKYFDDIKNECATDEFSNKLKELIATDLAVRIFRSEKKSEFENVISASEEKFKSLLEYLNESYSDASFDSAAKKMNLSKPYFSKLFFMRMGVTFTRYLNLIKVSNAVKLINEKKLKITDVAAECGFGTIRSFNRVFKGATGYSPKDLPEDYIPEYIPKYSSSIGFDPTLSTTEIIF